ncbi:MAG: right-handed parallel beta-helix repeat-containing protein [Bacteroidales bacterium]
MNRNKTIFFVLYIVLLPFLSGCRNAPVEIYISPSGADNNPGTLSQPLASIEKARNQIRELKRNGLHSDITVFLREGTYYLSHTFVLGLEDSAPEGFRITYRNYPGEQPVISSGVRVTGWERVDTDLPGLPDKATGKIWSADLPEGIQSFYTLYDGDLRIPRAVTEGFFPTREYEGNRAKKPEDLYNLHFPPGKLKNWYNLEDVEIVIQPSVAWTMNILPLESVDERNSIARTKIPSSYPLTRMKRVRFPEGIVWVENVFEGMDDPGCWLINTQQQKVYLWPENIDPGQNIMAPKLSTLIKVEGDSRINESEDVPVTGIHFSGLSFTQADRTSWDANESGIQHDWEVENKDNAMLRFKGAEYCSVEACHFYNAGGNAIRLDYHAQHIEIKNSYFHDLGASAVMMLGYGPGTKDVNKYNKVVNNHIHDCGTIWWHSQMITAWQSGENLIAHNYIHNVPRKAVCITGVRPPFFSPDREKTRECSRSIRFDETGTASTLDELAPYLHSRNNIVEFNHIHNALEKMGDGAAINVSGAGLGNIIRFNYVHDIQNPEVNSSIRIDNAQNGTLINHNIVFRSPNAGIAPKGDNVVRNNFLIDVSSGTGKGMIQALGNFGNSDIVKNVFVSTGEKDNFYSFIKDAKPPEVYQMMTDNRVDSNLYFSLSNPDFRENKILMDLQIHGFDNNSVYVDPLFENQEEQRFKLKGDSPALALGIEQINIMSKVGLTDDFPQHF